MSIVEMAKAHVQNVVQRIEELNKQQSMIQNEVEQLKTYADKCIKDIQIFEDENGTKGDK